MVGGGGDGDYLVKTNKTTILDTPTMNCTPPKT